MTPSNKKPRSSPRRWLEFLLLAAGVAGLGVWLGSKAIPPVWQWWENRQFNLRVEQQSGSPAPAKPGQPAVAPRIENGTVIGRLSIPRLKLSSMVREGDDATTLSLALGHIPSTALPGQIGNVGIAGHRDTLFRALRGIHKDDLIRFETVSGAHTYKVDSTRIVKPDNVGVLASNGTPALTLVTCYPFYYIGSAPERFIVSAHELTAARPVPQNAALRPEDSPQPVLRPAVLQRMEPEADRDFEIHRGQRKELMSGISFGLTDTDAATRKVYGWVWLKSDDRTILLRGQSAGEPVVFYDGGHRRELHFSSVSGDSVTGSLSQ